MHVSWIIHQTVDSCYRENPPPTTRPLLTNRETRCLHETMAAKAPTIVFTILQNLNYRN